MKKLKLLSSLVLVLTIFSCGGGSNKSVDEMVANSSLEELRAKKDELSAEEHTLAAEIEKLNKAIESKDTSKVFPLVTSITIKAEKFNHFTEVQGDVDTKQNLVLYPQFSGVLRKVYISEGQSVRKGQLLASIDDGGLSQQLNQAQIQADLSKTTFDKQKKLWDKNIGSEMQFLQSKANYEAQEKMVSQLKSQLSKANITAPFSGVVDEIMVDEGSVVGPGQAGVMRIINLDQMFVEAQVPEKYIEAVKKGKQVEVELPVLSKTYNSKINVAANYIKPENRSFRVEVLLDNKDGIIKPNMNAKLRINDYTSDSALLIPLNIISENSDGEKYVYVATMEADNIAKVKQTIIKTGKSQGEMVEVLSGLKPNDVVIQEGARSVLDGQKVKLLK